MGLKRARRALQHGLYLRIPGVKMTRDAVAGGIAAGGRASWSPPKYPRCRQCCGPGSSVRSGIILSAGRKNKPRC